MKWMLKNIEDCEFRQEPEDKDCYRSVDRKGAPCYIMRFPNRYALNEMRKTVKDVNKRTGSKMRLVPIFKES